LHRATERASLILGWTNHFKKKLHQFFRQKKTGLCARFVDKGGFERFASYRGEYPTFDKPGAALIDNDRR
jgi:hypothetical protein